ncbi:MAG: hypothetical protein P4L99_25945, partial [Chthoniobacter sp.]|nr:hypothetical protein [Chthoniobacter sp.]
MDFDNVSVASRLYAEFDLLAYGHTHSSYPEMRITPIGSAVLSQSGCLYEHRDYFNGYQFVKFRGDDGEVDFFLRSYFNRPRRAFDKAVHIVPDGRITLPYGGRATPASDTVGRFLREVRPVIRQAAAEQVNIVEAVSDLRLDPKEAFICPPLTVHRVTVDGASSKSEDDISPESILRSAANFVVVGARESGKSTLAHYFAVIAAEGAIDRPRIPVVIDFREIKVSTYGLTRAIATYFGAAKQALDVDARLEAGDFIIIVDNFTGRDPAARESMKALVDRFSACRWLLIADARPGLDTVQEDEADVLSSFRPVHIQSLPRKSIRELSRRWCDQIGIDNQKAFTAVMDQLREANLPRTGYMVTLLLWALYEERQFERINESLLLTYVIDHLLGKADFVAALKQPFDPTSKEITLQHLSRYLRSKDGIATKNEVVSDLIAFFNRKGLGYDASEVLRQLVECGLIKDADGLVSFKYRCFQEYFFAGLLRGDAELLSASLSGNSYLNYGRELELLSGLRRQNKDILVSLETAIVGGRPKELEQFVSSTFDKLAAEEAAVGMNRRRLEDIKRKTLTADQIDDLMDETERRAIERERQHSKATEEPEVPGTKTPDEIAKNAAGDMPAAPMSPIDFLISVDLLGRVVRNSEFTDIAEKTSATRLHLDSTARVALLYADVIGDIVENANSVLKKKSAENVSSDQEMRGVRYILNKWLVIMFSVGAAQQIGTDKLFAVFEAIFEDQATSAFEKLIIAMMFLELGYPKWLAIWKKVIGAADGNRFVLDILMERLWHFIHTRPLGGPERRQVEAAAEMIDEAFGIPKQERSTSRALREAANECVLLPSDIGDLRDKREVLEEVRAFIHRYVDLPPTFEAIAVHYVLLTWVYDAFSDLPYLRFRGDFGTGKTRALLTIGSLCYKPFFASGASSLFGHAAPIGVQIASVPSPSTRYRRCVGLRRRSEGCWVMGGSPHWP